MKSWFNAQLIWFIVGLVVFLLEFAHPALILFFFGLGAWIVAALCLIADISINTQLAVFIVTSLVLLFGLRNWAKAYFVGKKRQTDVFENDENVGQRAIVLKGIGPTRRGRIEIHGTAWDAESDEEIPENSTIEITGRVNTVYKVKPLNKITEGSE